MKRLLSVPSTRKAEPIKTGRMRRFARILAIITLILLFCSGFFLSVLPVGRSTARATLLLPALISASEPVPLSWFGDSVRFTRKTISSINGPVFLDIYEPVAGIAPLPGRREAIINIVGVGDNRSAPQLINLSRSFAREGIIVVNMGTPALFNYNISIQDSEAVVQTIKVLSSWPGVDPGRIGIIGFSAGSTLACLAAADPRVRDQLAFIALFGGYFDAGSMLHDFGRRALMVDGHTQAWTPNYVPIQVLANALSSALSPVESALLENAFAPGGTLLDASQQAQLSPGAAAAYHLLAGDEPGQVEQNIATLSPQMKVLLTQLSPSSVVKKISTPIYLLHDRSDLFLPFTQSRAFAATLARLHHSYDFAEFGIFQHVEVRSGLGVGQLLGDAGQLFRIVNKILLPAS